jgi:hypothetical protein
MEVWGGRKLREKENWPGTRVGVALDRIGVWWERVGGLTRAAAWNGTGVGWGEEACG